MSNKYLVIAATGLTVIFCGCLGNAIKKTVSLPAGIVKGAGAVLKKTGGAAVGIAKKATPKFAGHELELVEYDFVIDVAGSRRTNGHTRRVQINYNGEKCSKEITEQKTEIIREGKTFTSKVKRQVISNLRGEAVYSRELTIEGGSRSELIVKVDNGVAYFEAFGDGGSKKTKLQVPEGVLFAVDASWLASQELEPNKIITANVLSRRRQKVVKETATVLRSLEITFKGERKQAWSIKTVSEATPGNPVNLLITADGYLVRMDAQGASFRVIDSASGDDFSEPVEKYEVVTSVPLDFEIPAWDNFDSMVLKVVPSTSWAKHLADNEYFKVSSDGKNTLITLQSNAQIPAQVDFNMDSASVPAGLGLYVKNNGNIMPDASAIKKLARKITLGEKDALNAVAYLAGWVYDNIKWNSKGRMNTTPLETLKSKRGDCSEHADLFASLARAVNIPTRHCLGLLVQKNKAIYHNWVEVYLAGTWVPVDTTVNRVGFPAGYILTARDNTGTGELTDSLPWTMRTQKLGIKVVSLSRKSYSLTPGVKKSYVAFNGNWLANLLWGFALTKPDTWNGRIKLKAVELNSPDNQAKLICEALPMPYRISEGELVSLTRTLKWSMANYEQKQAKIITLQHGGASTEVLFVDYTCLVNKKQMRSQQYIIPRRDRSYRLSCWAPEAGFGEYAADFRKIVAGAEF